MLNPRIQRIAELRMAHMQAESIVRKLVRAGADSSLKAAATALAAEILSAANRVARDDEGTKAEADAMIASIERNLGIPFADIEFAPERPGLRGEDLGDE